MAFLTATPIPIAHNHATARTSVESRNRAVNINGANRGRSVNVRMTSTSELPKETKRQIRRRIVKSDGFNRQLSLIHI